MFLKQLQLHNFKNYSRSEVVFEQKINCFVGSNGAGKTNLLDAIYYLSFCKSYFNPIDSQNINHDENEFVLSGKYGSENQSSDLVTCHVRRNAKKQFKLNTKEYDRLADHIGKIPSVMLSPSDTVLITGGSEERRRYMDVVISQYDKVYLDDLINYNKALSQRNAYLKKLAEDRSQDDSMLELWDDQLVRFGERIHEKRKSFMTEFIPVFMELYNFISPESEKVDIIYNSQLNDENLESLLKKSRNKDRIVKYTNSGIHKDDLEFRMFEYPLKKFGSQGQQKSFVVSMKLAQFEFIYRLKQYKPLLLLDDIFDKLDRSRVEKLMELVSLERFGQIFITDTNFERIKTIFGSIGKDFAVFTVENAEVKKIDEAI